MARMDVFGSVLACVFAIPANGNAQMIPEIARTAGYSDLVFSDEFEGEQLSAVWANGMWYEKPSDPDKIKQSNGNIKLKSYASVTTLSRDLHSGVLFRHGYFEARMKIPDGRDNFGAFWLFSFQHAAGADNNKWCEIDIFENYYGSHFVGTIHDWINFRNTKNGNSRHKVHFDPGAWNTYGLLWQPGVVTWYLNGTKLMSSKTPDICEQQDLFLILTAQAHSKAAGLPLDVDWVRVYGKYNDTLRSIQDDEK